LKQYILFFLWSLWICSFYSCTDPILDNPFEEYIPPEISITNSVKSDSLITISWQADNQFALEFSYMLEPIEQEWSAWNADTSAKYKLHRLDENDYIFKVKSRYEEGSEQVLPDSILFTIDNILGPGLRFFPLYMEVYNSSTFTMDIYAEEVVGLIGAEISCSYDTGLVMLDTTAISAGSFLSAASGNPIIIKEYDVEVGSLILTIATLEDGTDLGGGTSLSGSGSLIQLPFTAISVGSFILSFSNTSVYVQEDAPETTVLYISLTSATVVIE
jgi:hypothetical protein